jgi:hypothetical protein
MLGRMSGGKEGRRGREKIHVTLYGRKESLQPFIRGGVRKISSEDLEGDGMRQ